MPQNSPEHSTCTRKASFGAQRKELAAPSTLNEQARTVGVVLATEAPVMAWTEYGLKNEVLLMSGASWPENGQAPLLNSHSRWDVTGQLGSLRGFRVEDEALLAEAYFSETAEQAFTLVREGHLTDVSVGCRILEHIYIPENTTQTIAGRAFTGPVKIVTRWEVFEGSFTPVGADKNAKTRVAIEAQSDGQTREEPPMPDKTADPKDQGRAANTNAAPDHVHRTVPQPAPETPADAPALVSRSGPPAAASTPAAMPPARSEEQIRADIADIVATGRMHNCAELAEKAIRDGTGVDKFRAWVLDSIATRSDRHAPNHQPPVEVGASDGGKFRAAASDALCLRFKPDYRPKEVDQGSGKYETRSLADGAFELRGYTLRELARECLVRAGLAVPHDPVAMIGRAFTESTSDFPNVLADAAHKALRQGFLEAPETFEYWTGEASANDFRTHTGVDLNAFSNLEVVPEGEEYTTGSLTDRGIRYTVATFGKIFGITRQAVINDDLNAFTKIPMAMGRAAMRTRGNAVYNILILNPQMPDGKALFSAAHGNLAAAGGAVNAATYKAGVVSMGTRVGDKGEALSIAPQYLIVPVSRQDEASILLNSMMIGTQAQPNQINPWKGAAEPVVEGRLDQANGAPWFMAGPRGTTISVAYLFGNKDVRMEQRAGWSVDGTEFKVSSDFGVFIEGYEALYKNPGA